MIKKHNHVSNNGCDLKPLFVVCAITSWWLSSTLPPLCCHLPARGPGGHWRCSSPLLLSQTTQGSCVWLSLAFLLFLLWLRWETNGGEVKDGLCEKQQKESLHYKLTGCAFSCWIYIKLKFKLDFKWAKSLTRVWGLGGSRGTQLLVGAALAWCRLSCLLTGCTWTIWKN